MKYAYKCKQCGCEFEKDKPLSAETTSSRCPKCGEKVDSLISGGCGFILKGGGWPGKQVAK